MKRIDGLDLARAIAIYGMFAAHIGDNGTRIPGSEGMPWLSIFDGRSAALFAVLTGVTAGLLLTRRVARLGHVAPTDADVAHTRWRLVGRALVLIPMGYVLDLLQVPVDVILANLGVMLLLATVATRWRIRYLAVASAVLAAVGFWLTPLLREVAVKAGIATVPVLEKLWSIHYPAVAWMAFVFAGMAVARLALGSPRVRAALAVGGAVLAALAYGIAAAIGGREVAVGRPEWTSVEPHSYTPFEMTGSIGVALAVIGGSLWLASVARTVLWPLLAIGSMALTAYTIQIFWIAIAGDDIVWEPSNGNLLWMILGITAFACAWKATLGQGPLEKLMSRLSNNLADKRVPAARTEATGES